MLDLDFKYKDLIAYLKSESPFSPEIAIILGSGLGGFAERVSVTKTIRTSELPGYPPSTIIGHEGKIHFAESNDKKLLLFQGRIHFYEGYHLSECILPAFISHSLGIKNFIATNAAGGVNRDLVPGDLMLNTSFIGINLITELTELIGISSVENKNNYLSLPSPLLNSTIRYAAKNERIKLKEGVYWYNKGPAYETPAEIQMMKIFGADAVGMSTIPEVYFAGMKGIKTSSISCITNYAAGISAQKLSHTEVTETADKVKETFERLIKAILSSDLN